jgi:hypothetical protein
MILFESQMVKNGSGHIELSLFPLDWVYCETIWPDALLAVYLQWRQIRRAVGNFVRR